MKNFWIPFLSFPIFVTPILLILYDVFIPRTNYKILKEKFFLNLGILVFPLAILFNTNTFSCLIPLFAIFYIIQKWIKQIGLIDFVCFLIIIIVPILFFNSSITPIFLPLCIAFYILQAWLKDKKIKGIDLVCLIFLSLFYLYAMQNDVVLEIRSYQQMFLALLIVTLECIFIFFFIFKIIQKTISHDA